MMNRAGMSVLLALLSGAVAGAGLGCSADGKSGASGIGINSRGGTLTIKNARIWTGDPDNPWADGIVIRDGKIRALDALSPRGRVIDAEGRLVVPGFYDSHLHAHVPVVLYTPGSPSLASATSVAEVQAIVGDYVSKHPEDSYPRLFGWFSEILPAGQNPTRQMLDEVVSDRPCYLVHFTGHAFWANTKALELANALEEDPPEMVGTGVIYRDPQTGLATGFLEETEYAATDGLLLRTVKKAAPMSTAALAQALRERLKTYPEVGITTIRVRDGDVDIVDVYEQILRNDELPVRVTLDILYTPYNSLGDITKFAERAAQLAAAGHPPGFFRADGAKLMGDLVITAHQSWLFEPYADGINGSGGPVFELSEFREQVFEADRLGLQIAAGAIGDRAVAESLNALEDAARENPPRPRRHSIEHAELIRDEDIPRFRQLGVTASCNTDVFAPDTGFQEEVERIIGKERLDARYGRIDDLIQAGALVVNGSDDPLFPPDPMLNFYLLTDARPLEGGEAYFPHRVISIEDALRTYTVNSARAAFDEQSRGMLKVGYDGDLAMLSDDILDEEFETWELLLVKTNLTVLNGHVMHEDFSLLSEELDELAEALLE